MKVRKAVIPAAGLGTRLFPASRAVMKEFFPVINRDGVAKPAIQYNVEEALNAGIEEIAIIIQPQDEPQFRHYFREIPPDQYARYVKTETAAALARQLAEISPRLTYLPQAAPEGFGHAVYCARDWVAGEPFLLMLGDHLFQSTNEIGCARQLVQIFEAHPASVSGVSRTPVNQLHLFGTVTGDWIDAENGLFQVTHLYEKPDPDYARQNLTMPGLPPDTFQTFFGMHVFANEIFDMLEFAITRNLRERGEFQLTSAQERLRQTTGQYLGLEVHGQRFDIGVPRAYQQTMAAFGR